jgi:ABC-type transporter Mla maintaining outer membrane lipid asymmetry ATPase subunit MlaF
VQQSALEPVPKGLQIGSIFRVWGGVGRGKTTLLRQVHEQTGGTFLGMEDFVAASSLKLRWHWRRRFSIWSSTP